jgi:lactoylglutathione lyase
MCWGLSFVDDGVMSGMTLVAKLGDWTDIDEAAHALAVAIGLMPAASRMSDAKWVYWSNNPLGNELHGWLDRLAVLGVLEKRDQPDFQYRTKRDFAAKVGLAGARPLAAADKEPPPELTLVVLRCADLERSREFYKALGLSFESEQHRSGPRHDSTRLGSTVLELYPAGARPATSLRLGIAVPEVSAAVAAVRGFGDVVLEHDDQDPHVRALVKDPDGNKIELTSSQGRPSP